MTDSFPPRLRGGEMGGDGGTGIVACLWGAPTSVGDLVVILNEVKNLIIPAKAGIHERKRGEAMDGR